MLHIHRAERADALVDALGALLAAPPADPLAADVVAVPTRGVERWLTQRLSDRLGATPGRRDGVCANVAFPSPHRLVLDALAAASGIDPGEDRWRPERAVWALLEVVDACLAEPWAHRLAAFLGATPESAHPAREARRLATLRRVAELFDRYALHRPELVQAWVAGEVALAPDARWQAELWRRLRERLDQPSPAERLDEACARLHEAPELLDLPERLALFGLTRLPAGHVRVLEALARRRDVHAFLLHPSPVLWERVRETRTPVVRRDDDPTALLPRHPLLASWGRDAREMQLVLARTAGHADHHHPLAQGPRTLLARLQADVRADRRPPGEPLPGEPDERLVLDPADRSVQVHACHGRVRQVEVLREAVLHLLADDPTLQPRDVVVLCPDVEAYAPLIHATFGGGEPGDDEEVEALPSRPVDLRVRLADRSLRQTNPVLGVVAQLLDLADARLTASQVLDLADRGPVRRRFRLDDGDLERLEEWVAESGIRWGLDAEHRRPFKLEAVPAGTWRAGLDRVLLGVAMAEEDRRVVGGVLPLDDVESAAIDLAGRFAELEARLHAAVEELAGPKPVAAWAEAIARAADALTATAPRDAWQRGELGRLLDDVVEEASDAPTELALPEVRALLAERLRGRPTRANFRTGHLTVCTLVPMRSVPHRVVCLLGLDDDVFPRAAPRAGDDLVLLEPRVGDRDGRGEDLQLLLDAVLAATDHLVVTYAGRDERTNLERPPAVPVGELLDVIRRTARDADRVLTRHPLQPFDPRAFTPGELGRPTPWSHDPVMLAGARSSVGPRTAPGRFLPEPLAPADDALVELEDLVRFVAHPVRAFLRRRLGVGVGGHAQEPADALPVELDGLETWAVGERILEARLAGCDHATAYRAEIARGALPPGMLGKRVVEEVLHQAEDIVDAARAAAGEAVPGSADVRVPLLDGRALGGSVPGAGDGVLRAVTFSRVAPRHRLVAWVRLLALTAAEPEVAWSAVTVGRAREGARRSARATVATLEPLGADAATRRRVALAHLAALVDLHDRAMREPPPLFCRTSAAYACAAAAGGDATRAAREAWESRPRVAKEDAEPEHLLVLGGRRSFAQLRAEPPREDERGRGWDPTEASRVGRWARRLWDPLLGAERVVDR